MAQTARAGSSYERVMEVALELFATRGFQATGIRELGEAVGMSSASLYHWFGTKEELLLAIMIRGQTRFLEAARTAVADLDEPEKEIVALTRIHVASHARDRRGALVIDHELRSLGSASLEKILPLRDAYEDLWRRPLERGRDIGRFHLESPKFARLGVIEMCNGVAHWYLPHGPDSITEICDLFADMVLSLLRAESGGRRIAVNQLAMPPAKHYTDLVNRLWSPEDTP